MKIKEIHTKVPGLETLYVEEDHKSGEFRDLDGTSGRGYQGLYTDGGRT